MTLADQEQIDCPCCGQAMPDNRLEVDALMDIPLTKTESAIVEKLVTDYPRRVTKQSLYDFVYYDRPDGGPEMEILNVYFTMLRAKLKKYGWEISRNVAGQANYNFYTLQRIQP